MITTYTDFKNLYLVKNGMASSEANLNKAPNQLKIEIDEINLLKQDVLVSGTDIKTINGTSILGSGDIITDQTNITGNAGTATKLQTPRTINGTSFDGSSNINITSNTVNSETIKFDSGTTEGTDLYTFNGSTAKTIDIKAGTNVTLTKTAGTITINANDTSVAVSEITGLGSGASTFLTTPTSANFAAMLTDETGSGANVFATSPTLVTPNIGVATGTSFNSITGLSSSSPLMDGTAAVGTSTTTARADHVHPSDTTKANLSGATFTGAISGTSATFSGDLSVNNLTVNGTTTTINSTTVTVDDINLELGSVTTPTDVTAAGGGITLKGTTDKTISWSAANGWNSSENWNLVTGKTYKINGADVLSGTTLGSGITSSSLTSVGTVTTGTWSASFGAVSGSNLTNLTAGNLTGTIPSAVLGNSAVYIGTTQVPLNRSTAAISLTGTSIDGNSGTATKLATARTIALTGDVTWSSTFDGSANITGTATLANSGVTAGTYGSASLIPTVTVDSKGRITAVSTNAVSIPSGSISVTGGDLTLSGNTGTAITNATLSTTGVTAGTYNSVTVDAKGRVTAGSNPTTLSGYGITDTYTKTQVDTSLSNKQDTLVSGTNIKTINGVSLLGSSDITVSGGATLTDDTSTDSSFYPVFTSSTSGNMTAASVSSTKLYFNPSTGTLNSTEFNAFSDINLKENVKTIDSALDKTLALRGVNYNLKDDENKSLKMGVIAQEVQKIVPEVIDESGKFMTVNYNSLVGLLIETIKELNDKITVLESKLQ